MFDMQPELLSKEDAEAILMPHLKDLKACLDFGWQQWAENLKRPHAATLRSTTRANMVYDFMVDEAIRRFEGQPGVHLSTARGFLTLTFDDKLILRFKKFRSRRLTTSGVSTQQRYEFEHQWLAFDGMGVTNVVAGYVLDRDQIQPVLRAVSCSYRGQVFWAIDLDEAGGATGSVQPLRQVDPDDDLFSVRSTIVAKEDKDKTEGS